MTSSRIASGQRALWPRVAVLAVVVSVAVILNFDGVDLHNASHWIFGYEFGFSKRGLVGAVASLLFGTASDTHAFIEAASMVVLAALAVLVVWISVRALQENPTPATAALLVLFASSPGTISFLAADAGRFDSINYLLMLLIALLFLRRRASSWSASVAGVLAAVAVLVHEAFVIVGLPMLAAMLWLKPGHDRLSRLVLFLVPPGLATGAVSFLGEPSGASRAELFAAAEARADFPVVEQTANIIDWTLWEHARSGVEWMHVVGGSAARYLVLVASVAPGLVAGLYVYSRRSAAPFASARRVVLVATMSPLLLFPIAHDHGRWVALATFNGFFAMIWLLLHQDEATAQPPAGGSRLLVVVGAVSLVSLAIGALPVMLGMPSGLDRMLN